MPHEHAQNNFDQISQEYRAIVLKKLDALEIGQKDLAADIVKIRVSFAQQEELKEIRNRTSILESFKYKLVGSLITLQVVLSIMGFFLNKLIKP